jgi:hypothetical protein
VNHLGRQNNHTILLPTSVKTSVRFVPLAAYNTSCLNLLFTKIDLIVPITEGEVEISDKGTPSGKSYSSHQSSILCTRSSRRKEVHAPWARQFFLRTIQLVCLQDFGSSLVHSTTIMTRGKALCSCYHLVHRNSLDEKERKHDRTHHHRKIRGGDPMIFLKSLVTQVYST